MSGAPPVRVTGRTLTVDDVSVSVGAFSARVTVDMGCSGGHVVERAALRLVRDRRKATIECRAYEWAPRWLEGFGKLAVDRESGPSCVMVVEPNDRAQAAQLEAFTFRDALEILTARELDVFREILELALDRLSGPAGECAVEVSATVSSLLKAALAAFDAPPLRNLPLESQTAAPPKAALASAEAVGRGVGLDERVGSVCLAMDESLVCSGFYEPEGEGAERYRWFGGEATMLVPVASYGAGIDLRIEGMASVVSDLATDFAVAVNGQPVRGEVTLAEGGRWSWVGFVSPHDDPAASALTLSLRASTTVVPCEAGLGPDSRPLSAAVSRVLATSCSPSVTSCGIPGDLE